jgi:hypothetical protein
MHGDLVAESVIAELVAVVGKEDNDRVLVESRCLGLLDQCGDPLIQATYIGVVGLDDLLHVGR